MPANRIVIIVIVIIQTFFIYKLCYKIYLKYQPSISSSTITENNIIKTENNHSNLKNYWWLQPNKISTESAYFLKKPVEYSINKDGLNSLKDYEVNKPHQTFRIITIGDSFTFGQYVNTNQNWPTQLEKKLNSKKICKNIDKFEVINFGVAGFDYQYEVKRYQEKGQKYNPDLII